MANYNERLDEVLLTYKSAYQIAFNEVDPHGNNMSPYDGSKAVSERSRDIEAEAKQAITSLIKELVAEAKPEKHIHHHAYGKPFEDAQDIAYNAAIDEFEQNLLKALEEV